ncbi:MAG: sortase domain-containing protein, partial [Anaerolineae bacterium]
MSDRRTVDELSIEELEAILAIRRREARHATLNRLRGEGRVIEIPGSTPPARPERPAREQPGRSRLKTWRDRLLLVVEIGALVGLVLVIAGVEQTRQELNQDVAMARDLPAPDPTPLITAVVLPTGHKPPTAPGGAAPNFDEIPAHLRAYVESVTPLPIPTPGPQQATRVQIPAINVDAPAVEGTDWESLKKGVGHYLGSANPGERGNL